MILVAKFDYARMTATASRLLDRFAQGTVVLTISTPTEPDPATPWEPGTPTTQAYTLDATVRGVSQRYIDGVTILASDLQVTAAVFGAVPKVGDDMTIDGYGVTILQVVALPAAGDPVAWRFIVRGGPVGASFAPAEEED